MALSFAMTKAVGRLLKPDTNVASLGYPDIIAPPEMILEILGGAVETLSYRDDSAAICKRHGLREREIPDAKSFFSLLGSDLDVYDIVDERGCEILCDLNFPMRLTKKYDMVLDVGTAEHCFNIGEAIKNMADMVAIGGYIVHENPFNWGNHGFYNLNPTLFADFYAANGFKLIECDLVDRSGNSLPAPQTDRFRFTDGEVNVFAVAQRTALQSFVFPVQSKYKHLIPAAGVPGEKEKEIANV